ncbi:hypothetical protein [Kitasatospora purpeofusca]|nr:hypothetical protein [Kitasatospora purpeofusca]MDY0810490.1 hypothetical protein [Kitasatospora purpeofusca]
MRPPDDGPESGDASPGADPVRVWAAYGVSVAAALHVLTAALVLIDHFR